MALALAVRLGAVAATAGFVPVHDPADYDRHAASIARGEGYPPSVYAPGGGPSAFRPPGYPYALAAIYKVAGRRWNVARAVQALLGTLTVALIGLLALGLWGRRVALVALALAAVYPPLVLATASLLSEALFLPLMLAALVLALGRRRAPPGRARAALIGVLAGAAILTRPVGAVLLVPLAIALWGTHPRLSRRAATAPVLMLAVAALAVSPWIVRNAAVMDELPLLSTEGGYFLAGTYNDAARDDPVYPAAWRPPSLVPEHASLFARPGLREVELERRIRDHAIRYMLDHPLYVLETGYRNTLRVLDLSGDLGFKRQGYLDLGYGRRLADAAIFSFYPLGLLALAGAAMAAARRAPRWLWLCPALLLAGVVFVQGLSRYRMPIDPFLVLLAALALAGLWERLWRRGAAPVRA